MPISVKLSHSSLASLSLASQTSGSSELVEAEVLMIITMTTMMMNVTTLVIMAMVMVNALAKPAEAVHLLKSQLMTMMMVAMMMTIKLMMTLMMTTTLTTMIVTMMMGKTLASPEEAVHSR